MSAASLIDPTQWVGLASADFGDVFSADGRAHPVTALTPLSLISKGFDDGAQPAQTDPSQGTDPMTGASTAAGIGAALPPVSGVAGSIDLNPLHHLGPFSVPAHFGARFVIGVIAVGLVLIVAFRLTLD